MQLAPNESNILCNLYDGQEVTVDKLGGTTELMLICLEFFNQTKRRFSEGEMLSALITLRKSGALTPKDVRTKKPAPKPTFPRLKDLKVGKYYAIEMPVRLNADRLKSIITTMIIDEKAPLSRDEVYQYLIENPDAIFMSRLIEYPIVQETFDRLFGEME